MLLSWSRMKGGDRHNRGVDKGMERKQRRGKETTFIKSYGLGLREKDSERSP